jgi:hypothetical protein
VERIFRFAFAAPARDHANFSQSSPSGCVTSGDVDEIGADYLSASSRRDPDEMLVDAMTMR